MPTGTCALSPSTLALAVALGGLVLGTSGCHHKDRQRDGVQSGTAGSGAGPGTESKCGGAAGARDKGAQAACAAEAPSNFRSRAEPPPPAAPPPAAPEAPAAAVAPPSYGEKSWGGFPKEEAAPSSSSSSRYDVGADESKPKAPEDIIDGGGPETGQGTTGVRD